MWRIFYHNYEYVYINSALVYKKGFIIIIMMHEKTTTTKSYCLLLGMKADIKHHNDGLLDYLLMGGSLTLVLGTILTVITSYYFCYYRKKRRGKMQLIWKCIFTKLMLL